jgi:hypothetical protein
MSSIAVAGAVVSSIAPRQPLAPQLERIVADHLTRFVGVPAAVYLPNPGALTSITVCHHTIPVCAGWPPDAARWQADYSVAVVYPPFGEVSG